MPKFYKLLHNLSSSTDNNDDIKNILYTFKSLWVNHSFINPKFMAIHTNLSYIPYLYQCNKDISSYIIELFQIQLNFNPIDIYIPVLSNIYHDYKNKSIINNNLIAFIFSIINILIDELKKLSLKEIKSYQLYVLNNNNELQATNNLIYNDANWLIDNNIANHDLLQSFTNKNMSFVHQDIKEPLLLLNIVSLKSLILKNQQLQIIYHVLLYHI